VNEFRAEISSDIRAMLRIAIPLAMAELGWMLMSVVDNVMVGQLPDSAVSIGAASLGGALFYGFAIFGIGMMSGLDTLVSHAYGAGDWPEARKNLAAGLGLAVCLAPVIAALILGSTPLLGVIGVKSPVRERAVEFTRTLVWSLPLLLIYTTFRRYLQGIHYVKPVMFALVTSNLVNLFGNWLLIFGHWGFPAMGIRGSAVSTVIARVYLAAFMGMAVWMRDPAAFRAVAPDWGQAWKLLKLGLPAALTIGFEVGVFNAATAIIGILDPVSLAAHTIALNAAALTYMVPLGIGSAAAVSVGHALGAKNRSHAARAGWTAIGIGVAYEICSALVLVLFPGPIARIYTHDPAVISLTIKLFAVAAVFQIFDGLQTVATGALRGAGNTRTAMVWNLIGYWAIGLPVGCWVCFVNGWGAVGIWDGLCLALIVVGVGLVGVWRRQTIAWKTA
jgi:MATE family multidrug resistance protein